MPTRRVRSGTQHALADHRCTGALAEHYCGKRFICASRQTSIPPRQPTLYFSIGIDDLWLRRRHHGPHILCQAGVLALQQRRLPRQPRLQPRQQSLRLDQQLLQGGG